MEEIKSKIKDQRLRTNMLRYKNIFTLLICIFGFLFLVFGFSRAQAATLYLSPSTGTYNLNQTFSVGVFVSSSAQPVNAYSAVLSFPQQNIEVVSISQSGSIVNLWVQEPNFSNTAGRVNFEGVTFYPGFQGPEGKIITITFQAKVAGTASLRLTEGTVLTADGFGTNILESVSDATYSVEGSTGRLLSEVEEPKPQMVGLPAVPVISSPTHPNSERWYSDNSPSFIWNVPADVTAVRLLVGRIALVRPTVLYKPAISERHLKDLDEGVWYFSVQFRNAAGWGAVSQFKFQIDIEPPEPFEVAVVNEEFIFETTDKTSGIDRYEIILNGELYKTVLPEDIKDRPYRPSPLPLGNYLLEVKAFDKAGNYTITSTSFEVLAIGDITITKMPLRIGIGDILRIEGETLPQLFVKIYIQREGEKPIIAETTSDLRGNFVLQYDKALSQGDYLIWVQGEDERGRLTNLSEKYFLKIGLPPFLQFSKTALDYLTPTITLIILIVGVLVVIFYFWYRISLWRRRLRQETKEVSRSVLNAFQALRKEVEGQIEYLDGRAGTTKDERLVRDRLKRALNISEEFISKELKDIEKELK